MKTFKRASAAYAYADENGNLPVLRIGLGKEALYIVGVERATSIELVGPKQRNGISTHESRVTAGHITLGHLDRLGNANGAYGAEINRYRAFPGAGLLHRYHDPKHQAEHDAARAAGRATTA